MEALTEKYVDQVIAAIEDRSIPSLGVFRTRVKKILDEYKAELAAMKKGK